MTETVICDLPDDQKTWRPDPFPGSPEAKMMGCGCPVAQPWPGQLEFAEDCPVHVLEAVAEN